MLIPKLKQTLYSETGIHDEGSLFNHAGRGRHHGVFARADPTSKISEIH
jgi:hypothetical protein